MAVSAVIICMLVGGGLMLVGAMVGFLVGRYAPARRRTPKPVEPICGCGHNVSFHDLSASRCHKRAKLIQCTCRQYTGPVSIDLVYAPELNG